MDRIIAVDPELLEWSLTLSPEERLRQANAAFRLYHALHHPFAAPFCRGFDSFESFWKFEREEDHPL